MSPQDRRRRHRLLGLTLLLPLAVWALTGAFFLVRPGYEQAYETVPVRQYPPASELTLELDPEWLEIRYFRTLLGDHLIVREETGWEHLRAADGTVWAVPDEHDLERLLQDAVSFRPERYGTVGSVSGNQATTDTGVELTINWTNLTISQYGSDTRWIDRVYSWHYLRWTGIRAFDTVLSLSGLALLMFLTWSGARLAFRP